MGFAGALRRSELAGIQISELERTDRGFQVTLPRSKGAQTSAVTVPIPYGKTELCPVRALTRWLGDARISEGRGVPAALGATGRAAGSPRARFVVGTESLAPRSIARIVQARAMAAGFRTAEFGGPSLKRGALTTGKDLGVHPSHLKRLGRHATFDVLGEYLEFGDLFENHPLSGIL